jgi:hypothetical protein
MSHSRNDRGRIVHLAQFNDDLEQSFDCFKSIDGCVTLESQTGFIFDAGLAHSGAPVDFSGCTQSKVLQQMEVEARSVTRTQDANKQYFEAVFNQLCRMEGIDSISRLHTMLLPMQYEVYQQPNYIERTGLPAIPEF